MAQSPYKHNVLLEGQPWATVPKDQAEATLFEYMRTTAWVRQLADGGGDLAAWNDGDDGDPALRAEMRAIWAALRNARVVHISPETLIEAWDVAERWVWEHVVGVPHDEFWGDTSGVYMERLPDGRRTPKPEWIQATTDSIAVAAVQAPWPQHMPFDHIYLGYGTGVTITDWRAAGKLYRAGLANVEELTNLRIAGHLLTASGACYEITYLGIRPPEGYLLTPDREGLIVPNLRRHGGLEWRADFDISPWMVPLIIEMINLNKTTVVATEVSAEAKRVYRRSRKERGVKASRAIGRRGHQPPPFYRLRLRDRVIRVELERALSSLFPSSRALSYRHDRRAHERCYIRRGPLPLDATRRENLRATGYTIYEHRELTDDDSKRLRGRGQAPKRPDEWLAVRTRWIEHTIVGDESLPYVPALRIASARAVRP